MSAPGPRTRFAAVAQGCVSRPWLTVAVAALLVGASVLSLGRLRVSASLEAMLGASSPAGQALRRVASDYRAGDALYVIVEGPVGEAPDHAALVAYAERLAAALRSDPRTRDAVEAADFRPDPDVRRYVREVVLPAAPYYLGPGAARELVARLSPERLAAQFARNAALAGAPGPAGAALSGAVLRDPLRLFELAPAGLRLSAPELLVDITGLAGL
ncbi:MAG: hypothetical protein WD749_07505, partial [Phycisphaerales bacterium]